jgi:hypothetical protein
MPISKTDFVRGLQCEKMLWLDAHAPEYKIIPPEVQAKLDAGNEFGDTAMGIFGEFVETTTLREDGRLHFAAMLEKTNVLLCCETPVICEAAFTWYGNYCAADLLKKDGDGYAIYEVKNAPTPRKEFITDLGFQRLILRKSGVLITSSFLILPATDNQTEGELYEVGDDKYRIVDVTKAAKVMERIAEKRIFELGKLKRKDAPLPALAVGEQCDAPYRCWYYEYCHGKQEQPNTGE